MAAAQSLAEAAESAVALTLCMWPCELRGVFKPLLTPLGKEHRDANVQIRACPGLVGQTWKGP